MAKVKTRTAAGAAATGKGKRADAYKGTGGNLGNLWKTAKAKVASSPSPFATVEDGNYPAFLHKCICDHDDSGRLIVDFGLKVTEGAEAGKGLFRRAYLETQENFEFFLRDLQRLEVDLSDLDISSEADLKTLCEELQKAGLVIRCRMKTGESGYQNLYFQKLLERDAEAPADAGGDGGEASDAGSDGGEAAPAEGSDEALLAWKGKKAAYKQGKTVFTGTITKVDVDTEQFTMKTTEGKTITGDVEALEEIAAGEGEGADAGGDGGEGEAELNVNDTVEFPYKGKDIQGKVIRIAADGSSAKVLVVGKSGKMKLDVKIEDLLIIK